MNAFFCRMSLNRVSLTRLVPLLLMVASACSVLPRPAGAQITKVGDKYLFRVRFTKGQTIRYTMTTTAHPPTVPKSAVPMGQKGLMITTSPMSMNVLDVRGKVATLEVSIGPFVVNGETKGEPQSARIEIDERNFAVHREKGSPVGAGFPLNPIKIGESYHIDQDVTKGGLPLKVKATYVFKGIKSLGKLRVAELTSTTITQGKVMTRGTGTVYLSLADGTMVSTTGRQTATTTEGVQSASMTTDTVVTRL